jgi:hypothetical protein
MAVEGGDFAMMMTFDVACKWVYNVHPCWRAAWWRIFTKRSYEPDAA